MREIERIADKIDRVGARPGDIHPTESALVIRASAKELKAEALTWGYEAAGKKSVLFNARSETVRERPMFRRDYETRRCIVPVKKFYEWKALGLRQKEKYEFFAPQGILYLAGIYHGAPEGNRFAVLTREAEGCMTGIHARMPVILRTGDMEKWLFSVQEADRLLHGHFQELQRRKSGEEYSQMSFL